MALLMSSTVSCILAEFVVISLDDVALDRLVFTLSLLGERCAAEGCLIWGFANLKDRSIESYIGEPNQSSHYCQLYVTWKSWIKSMLSTLYLAFLLFFKAVKLCWETPPPQKLPPNTRIDRECTTKNKTTTVGLNHHERLNAEHQWQ